MNTRTRFQLSFHDACHAAGVDRHFLIEIVEHGIVEPPGELPEQWRFDDDMLSTVRRACRLCRDLEMDLAAAAMVLELLDEKERLQRENAVLRRRLQRFLHED